MCFSSSRQKKRIEMYNFLNEQETKGFYKRCISSVPLSSTAVFLKKSNSCFFSFLQHTPSENSWGNSYQVDKTSFCSNKLCKWVWSKKTGSDLSPLRFPYRLAGACWNVHRVFFLTSLKGMESLQNPLVFFPLFTYPSQGWGRARK